MNGDLYSGWYCARMVAVHISFSQLNCYDFKKDVGRLIQKYLKVWQTLTRLMIFQTVTLLY